MQYFSPITYLMKKTSPIRSLKQLQAIKNILIWQDKVRDLLLLELWVNSALRITDLLSLQVRHLYQTDGTPVEFFTLRERKTGKTSKITITPKVKATLKRFREKYHKVVSDRDNYVFYSTRYMPHWIKQMDRRNARVLINKRTKSVGLKWSYWWHTLRKTRGYQARLKGIPLPLIMHRLNHSSLAVTKLYLCITDDELEEACMKIDL